MPGNYSLANKSCFIGEHFTEDAKSFLRKEVCKYSHAIYVHDEKPFCVLHYPDNQKHKTTDFVEVLKHKIKNDENNFCGIYFSGFTVFKDTIFENSADFSYTHFDCVIFENVSFKDHAIFNYSILENVEFKSVSFNKTGYFIGASFGLNTIGISDLPIVNFSNILFSEAVFQSSVFHKSTSFGEVVSRTADFSKIQFKGGVSFFETKFNHEVSFDDTIFDGITEFNNTNFDCDEHAKWMARDKSFIITSSFRKANFADVRFTKSTFEAVDFRECVFEKVQFWESTFRSLADFELATFKALDFYKVKFLNEANFKKAKFQDKGGFFLSDFKDSICFTEAVFENSSDILFNFTAFHNLIDFRSSIVIGYLSFNETSDEKIFLENTDLNFEYIRVEKPEKVSFHTVDLRPHWFINVDCRKFTFINVSWGRGLGKRNYKTNELKEIEKRDIKNPRELFKIACRQIAENAENNNRFEEASNFRQMAFETERLERKEKYKIWKKEFADLLFEGCECKRILPVTFVKAKGFGDLLKSHPFDFVHFLYRWLSKYGENWFQAFSWLIFTFVLFALFYWLFGSFGAEGKDSIGILKAFPYSLQVMTLQKPEPRPFDWFTQFIYVLETIFAPLQAALLALAIRRKFMR